MFYGSFTNFTQEMFLNGSYKTPIKYPVVPILEISDKLTPSFHYKLTPLS